MADNATIDTKLCSSCREVKPIDEFHVWRTARDGRQGACKACQRAYHSTDAGKERQRNGHYQRRFGLSLAAYEAMLAGQGGVCALCQKPPQARRLHVDHDHATGTIRGLLCQSCNRALGYLGDDPDMVLAAFTYLTGGGRHS